MAPRKMFSSHPFISLSLLSPPQLFVLLIYGGIEVGGQQTNGKRSRFVMDGGKGR